MGNPLGLVGGAVLLVCWGFILVGTATEFWRYDGRISYGIFNLCVNNGHECFNFEDLFPEKSAAIKASQAFSILALICGIFAIPMFCIAGTLGKCICLAGRMLGALASVLALLMILCAVITFSVMIGTVQESVEYTIPNPGPTGGWEYSYSMGLFTTGWTLACCVAPLGFLFKDEDD